MTDTTQDTTAKPGLIAGLFLLLLTPALGLLMGGLGGAMPFIIVKVLIGVVVVFGLIGIGHGLSGNGALRFVLAIVAGVLALAGFWFGWIWQLQSFDFAKALFLSGPGQVWAYLSDLSQTFSYNISRRGSATETGNFMTLLIWGLNSGAVLLAPLVGALRLINMDDVDGAQHPGDTAA